MRAGRGSTTAARKAQPRKRVRVGGRDKDKDELLPVSLTALSPLSVYMFIGFINRFNRYNVFAGRRACGREYRRSAFTMMIILAHTSGRCGSRREGNNYKSYKQTAETAQSNSQTVRLCLLSPPPTLTRLRGCAFLAAVVIPQPSLITIPMHHPIHEAHHLYNAQHIRLNLCAHPFMCRLRNACTQHSAQPLVILCMFSAEMTGRSLSPSQYVRVIH